MRISDWSSDVCSSDLAGIAVGSREHERAQIRLHELARTGEFRRDRCGEVTPRRRAVTHADSRLRPDQLHRIASDRVAAARELHRSEEHTSELQSLMRISYAVFCLKKKRTQQTN